MAFLFVLLGVFGVINGDIRLSGIITDNMVLQTPYPEYGVPPTKLFGQAFLNETVTITGSTGFPGPFTLAPIRSTSNDFGNWSQAIIPDINDPSFPGPYTITFETKDVNGNITSSITVNNTYFGEVILCSGQSNMELTLNQCDGGTNAKNNAANYPNVRLYRVNAAYSNFTLQNLTGTSWFVPTADNIGGFSCVCYETGIYITDWMMQNSNTRPYIGLIEANIGGTSGYFWASGQVGTACNLTGQLPSTGML